MFRRANLAILLTLTGCGTVRTVTDLATMPVRAASKAVDTGSALVDATTVSQFERDARRGREIRQREERLGQLDRDHRKFALACDQGDSEACARRDAASAEMQTIIPTIPYEPRPD